jgi:thiamine transport system permease protein
VAIYQSLRFDFDIPLAVALAAIQLLICLALMAVSSVLRQDRNLGFQMFLPFARSLPDSGTFDVRQGLWPGRRWSLVHWSVIALAGTFVILPLLAMVISSINDKTLTVFADGSTVQALFNTLLVSLCAACLSVLIGLGLLSSTRHLRTRMHRERAGQWVQMTGNVILIVPPLVLGTGLFLLLRPVADVFSLALVLVIVINSLMALPFVLRVLDGPVISAARQHDRLIQSLGIRGWNRWRLIDWPQLRGSVALALAVSATLAAGDLGAIALFGSERVRTLPLLLYQRMGSYRLEEAAVTAGILLSLCLCLFAVIQWVVGGRRHAAT